MAIKKTATTAYKAKPPIAATKSVTTYEDKRMVKFEKLICEIDNKVLRQSYFSPQQSIFALRTIFDSNKLNKYGKFIFKSTHIISAHPQGAFYQFETPLKAYYSFNNQYGAMKMILNCYGVNDRPAGYMFIFWALMILAVDDTDKEEHLSLICDYSKMLQITEEEMLDLVNVVKYVFQVTTFENPKTDTINKYFGEVLKIYA